MNQETVSGLTIEDHQKAFTEVAFLIDIFTSTIDTIMGGSTASVGRMAGRDTAKKYPIHLDSPSLAETVAVIANRMKAGFAISLEGDDADAVLLFGRCILRDICGLRGIQPGNAMCKLFHAYVDGVVNELICRPVKSEITACGEQCRARVRIQ
ncbi:MAG: hypothetical protein IH628_04985 [Proteobacteria bacterium]|nr:hypothetical protein [Pseudomonadota bacterium]